jgi:hypothetical protein
MRPTPRVLIILEGGVVEGIAANTPVECMILDRDTGEDDSKMAPEVCQSEVDEGLAEEALTLAKEGKAVQGELSGDA